MTPEIDELPPLEKLANDFEFLSRKFRYNFEHAIKIATATQIVEDHLVVASLRVGIDHIAGIAAMLDQRNLFCAAPIVRFQLDAAMTLFARTIVPNVDEYAFRIMDHEKRETLLDRDGKKMKDWYLHEKLSEKYSSASVIYKRACEFIHSSDHHLIRCLDRDEMARTGKITFRSHDEIITHWTDEEIEQTILTFNYASLVILTEHDEWKANRTLKAVALESS